MYGNWKFTVSTLAIIAGLLITAIVGAALPVDTDPRIVTLYEDGSFELSNGNSGCLDYGLCNDDIDVAWNGVTQDSVADCSYYDGWGEAECVVAAKAMPGETLAETMSRLGY